MLLEVGDLNSGIFAEILNSDNTVNPFLRMELLRDLYD